MAEANKSWGAWSLIYVYDKSCTIDCSIRGSDFKHILTVYDIMIYYILEGLCPWIFKVGGL